MTSARHLLFALTRQRFTAAHQACAEAICQRAPVDWASVCQVAASEGVAPIVGVHLAACDPGKTNVPAEVTARLQHALLENVALKAERRREFTEQLTQLRARGYDVLLLKSAALEAGGVYEHPWVTCALDMDIVLRVKDVGRESRDNAKFRGVLNDTYGVENGDYTGHHDLSLNGIVSWPADDLWRAARPVRLDGVPAAAAYVMCPEDQLWTLCLNSCRKRFFRLKALFDIAETVAHYPDLDWEYLARRVRSSGSEGIVFAALRAADDTLGLPAEARPRYSALLNRRRAVVLGSIVTLLRCSRPGRRVTRTALQYASFSPKQRWRSAKGSVWNRLPRHTAAERAEARLPGEQG
jgi:hypothetical protein